MKKIMFLMPTVFTIGGEQRVVSQLSNLLVDYGYEVELLLFNDRIKENYKLFNLSKKICIKYIKGNSKIFYRFCRKIRNLNSKYGFLSNFNFLNKFFIKNSFPFRSIKQIISTDKPDVIVGVASDFNLLCSLLKPYFKNTKFIGWQHSCYSAYFLTKGRRHFHEKELVKELFQNLDKYVVLTKNDQYCLKEYMNIDSTCIYNVKGFSSNIKSNLDSHYFLSAGRFDYVKGYDMLIDSFNIFISKNKNTDWKLILTGDGEEKNNLVAKVKAYNLGDKVIFTGFKNDMIDIYSKCSIYVMSSRWEGFPMALGECFEMQLPIISFDIDVMKEFIDNYENGILVEKNSINKLADAMTELSNNIELRKKIAIGEKKKIQELNGENIIKKWVKLIEE